MRIQKGHRNMSFWTDKMPYTTFLVRRRRYMSPLQFQLIPSLVTISPWLPFIYIFSNIHLMIITLKKSNGEPVMMSPVTILKRTLLSTPTFEKLSLAVVSSHSPCLSPSSSSRHYSLVHFHIPYMDFSRWLGISRPTCICS